MNAINHHWYTDSELRKLAPDAWREGYEQGLNPECGTKERPYECPYDDDTVEVKAWRKGCWWGFVRSEELVGA